MQFKPVVKDNGLGRVPSISFKPNPYDSPQPRDNTPTDTGGAPSTGGDDDVELPTQAVEDYYNTHGTIDTGYKPPVKTTTYTPLKPSYTPTVKIPQTSVNTPVVQQINEVLTTQKQWIKGLTNLQTGLLGFGVLAGATTLIIVVAKK